MVDAIETNLPVTLPVYCNPIPIVNPVLPDTPSATPSNPPVLPPPPVPQPPSPPVLPPVEPPTPIPPIVIPDFGTLICDTHQNICTGNITDTYSFSKLSSYHRI